MSPTEGVLSEAWALYKAHWRHLLSISFLVYAAVALINLVLVAEGEEHDKLALNAILREHGVVS